MYCVIDTSVTHVMPSHLYSVVIFPVVEKLLENFHLKLLEYFHLNPHVSQCLFLPAPVHNFRPKI